LSTEGSDERNEAGGVLHAPIMPAAPNVRYWALADVQRLLTMCYRYAARWAAYTAYGLASDANVRATLLASVSGASAALLANVGTCLRSGQQKRQRHEHHPALTLNRSEHNGA
jgi:hypothetical protein